MSTCPDCHRPVVSTTYGQGDAQQHLLLEPGHTVPAYVSAEMGSIWPQEGDRVFLGAATIPHELVCPAQWRKKLAQQARNSTAKRDARHLQGVK